MLNLGDRFGPYKVVRRLGQGGMGAVFLLVGDSGGLVAAKILNPETARDHEARRRFLREAELARDIRHPNLLATYDIGEDPDTGLCYILMEYAPGGSLAERIEREGPLPLKEALSIARQVMSALERTWRQGIVHRDVKPDNILFGSDGSVRLSDLGIARQDIGRNTAPAVTQTGMMIGTPAYMAPEQMLDSHTVDCRADLYALGVVLYEMLAGSRPYADDSAVELLVKKMRGVPPGDIRLSRPETPSALAELIAALCAPQAKDRPSTPTEVLRRLSEIDLRPKKALPTAGISSVPARPRLRGRFRRPSGSLPYLLLALGTSVLAYLGMGPGTDHPSRPAWTHAAFWREQVVAAERRSSIRARTAVGKEAISDDETRDDDRPVLKTVVPPPDRRALVIRIDPLVIRSEEGVNRSSVERLAASVREALPRNKAIFGDPYAAGLKTAAFIVAVSCRTNQFGSSRYRLTTSECRIVTGRSGGFAAGNLADRLCAAALYVAPEPNWEDLAAYAQGRKRGELAPLDELVRRHPSLMRDYFALKLKRGRENLLYGRVTVEQEVELFSSVVGRDVKEVFARFGWWTGKRRGSE